MEIRNVSHIPKNSKPLNRYDRIAITATLPINLSGAGNGGTLTGHKSILIEYAKYRERLHSYCDVMVRS